MHAHYRDSLPSNEFFIRISVLLLIIIMPYTKFSFVFFFCFCFRDSIKQITQSLLILRVCYTKFMSAKDLVLRNFWPEWHYILKLLFTQPVYQRYILFTIDTFMLPNTSPDLLTYLLRLQIPYLLTH